MSAQPATPNAAPDTVSIEIDGKSVVARKGSMIIENTDREKIPVPRFCYHEKLSIAANCRMCLVDVEKSPKPVPACATPVMDGMKIYTRSKRALDSQRNVMEFLLLNHPLDCPICDQGGECELQDVAMGYGRSVSRYTERKRVVPDEDLGPLIETEMTRCIHCTRCIRYSTEIAGTPELGGMGRGEHLEIGTFIGRSLTSEMSAGVIDVCPVGALTNKVFRYRARAWELQARPAVGYHDAIGGNLFLHVRRGEALRAVPRDNEAINECWSADRDRFAHQGLVAADRAQKPMLKRDGQWSECSWEEALAATVSALRAIPAADWALLAGPATSCEEGLLLQQLAQGMGIPTVDHRLRQLDFSDDAARVPTGFGAPLAEMEQAGAILIFGSNPRHEAPLLGHRIRKAQLRGAVVHALNLYDYAFHFTLKSKLLGNAPGLVHAALRLAVAAQRLDGAPSAPAALAALLVGVEAGAAEQTIIADLQGSPSARILLGLDATRHPQASILRAVARYVAAATAAVCDELPDGANAAGLARLRFSAGHARAAIERPRRAYVLFGAEAPEDFALGGVAGKALKDAERVVAFASFVTDALKSVADVILPLALTPETEATLVNAEGRAQRLPPATRAPGEARPGWRILRVLGEQLGLAGFDFTRYEQLADRVDAALAQESAPLGELQLAAVPAAATMALTRRLPLYAVDGVIRRCAALQQSPLGETAGAELHPEDALKLGVGQNGKAKLGELELPVRLSTRVPRGSIVVTTGEALTAGLPPTGHVIEAAKA
ncbi:MAG: NADH-quinone oxidoreductase subunit NuoG [Xanthomonadales bacterium]|jgi:NADH-quinone oxidoreductase subunit G|nr:NADH-quinone oxidoreductase subunit NuoG [Xanthomonadales bacterium]